MATQWILGKVSDALAPTVSSACASAGTFAGGAMNTIGSSINGVGESINNSIRGYGDGAKDYGNAIKDWTGAPGARAQTASNPLGLSDTREGGKAKTTSPTIYRAAPREKKAAPKPAPAPAPVQKKVTNKSRQTGSTAATKPKPKAKPTVEPATKKVSPLKANGSSTRTSALSNTGNATKPPTAATAVKPRSSIKTGVAAAGGGTKAPAKKNAAANPLGLSF